MSAYAPLRVQSGKLRLLATLVSSEFHKFVSAFMKHGLPNIDNIDIIKLSLPNYY